MVALVLLMAGCGGETNKAMSLQFYDQVYVVLNPASVLSLDKAAAEKGYGNVKADDLVPDFLHENAQFGEETKPAIAVYSDSRLVPPGKMYMAIRVRQVYAAALKDEKVTGIVMNLNAPQGTTYTMTKTEIQEALPKMKKGDPLPKKISINQ